MVYFEIAWLCRKNSTQWNLTPKYFENKYMNNKITTKKFLLKAIKKYSRMKKKLTDAKYFPRNWYAPKSPKIIKIMWRKLASIGANIYPKKSNICRSMIVSCKDKKELKSEWFFYMLSCLHGKIDKKRCVWKRKSFSHGHWRMIEIGRKIINYLDNKKWFVDSQNNSVNQNRKQKKI